MPKPDSRSLTHHFQVSTQIVNLQPSDNYTVDLSIGHRKVAEGQNPIYDPKYTIRLKDRLLNYGAICGFAYSPCPLTGSNNSAYTTMSMPFQADSPNATLTVYLSWYNGNFHVPLYLDSVVVRSGGNEASNAASSTDSSLQVTASASLAPRLEVSSITSKANSVTSAPAGETDVPDASGLTCPMPDSCLDQPPPLEITERTLRNSGFENSLEGWEFISKAGKFRIARTKQSLDGDFAV